MGEPESVVADLRQLNPAISGEDAGIIIFGWEDGRRAVFDGNRLADHAATNCRLTMGEMQIDAQFGSLRLDGEGRLFRRNHGGIDWTRIPLEFASETFGGDCVYHLQKQVVERLSREQKPENTAADYLRNLEIQEAIYNASERGRKVSLQPGVGR